MERPELGSPEPSAPERIIRRRAARLKRHNLVVHSRGADVFFDQPCMPLVVLDHDN